MAEGGGGNVPPDIGPGVKKKMAENGTGTKRKEKMDVEFVEQPSYAYEKGDYAPYRVYVELADKTNKINKFSLGSWLRKMEKYRKSVTEMKYLGRNKIIVFMSHMAAANSLIVDDKLKEAGYKAYVPRHLVCISGVLAGIPMDIPTEEIKNEIQSPVPVTNVFRLSRYVNGEKLPSNRVSVTFRTKVLPEKIKLFCTSCKVNPFFRKVEFCTNCHRFNHKAINCKGRQRCDKCGRIHSTDDSNFQNCNEDVKCFHCRSSTHRTTDPNCPERLRQASINTMMAKKCISYVEARELVAPIPVQNSYDLLANMSEFPSVQDSYAKMTAGRYVKKSPETINRTVNHPINVTNIDNENGASKRKRAEVKTNTFRYELPVYETSTTGTGLNNSSVVTEKENWESAINEAYKKAEASAHRNAKSSAISFYSALMQIPEITDVGRDKIKECSKRFLMLDDFMI